MKIIQRTLPDEVPSFKDLPPLLQRIYASRGIKTDDMLDRRLHALLPFNDLLGIDKARERLHQALLHQERILVIGDFDADGATSTALAVSALRSFGANSVSYLVPNRFEYGYGLTPPIVDVAKEMFNPQLIITVDNGITSFEGVDIANAYGIDVLITDHHLAASSLPNACAIVNPNQHGCSFKSKSIAGVGVIFYVMLALRRTLVDNGWFEAQGIAQPNMSHLLDLVALGTVADVVGLDQNNRILVRQGLMRIQQGYARPGIMALIEVAGRKSTQLRESDLGFAIAPRLNAAGRLDDMSLGIACLLSEEPAHALSLAKQLDALNVERRKIEQSMKEQALASLERLEKSLISASLPSALCLFDESWHQGVIGILAGRIKERYHRPVVAFAKVSDEELKGSLRSVDGLNIRDVLADIDKDNPGLIKKFGGHAMAAGMSLEPESLPKFKKAFIDAVSQSFDGALLQRTIYTDGALQPHELSLETVYLLQEAGPWGAQFPEPLFDDVFEVVEQRLVGQHHLKLTVKHPESHALLDAIAFNVDTKQWPNHRARYIHAVFRLDSNTYMGRTKLQLMLEYLQPQEARVGVWVEECQPSYLEG